ncbi:hypothetical protein LSTR_LSTR008860 [Laodelphax striatellus]|uniref:Uncharacterized protein n=1 Tax=Laodelphax striatellus TaxID=195883 RepID=A0A482WSD1_LAOST|nr:hypothetical protein LSTR_LSTR008860 [Laodelphax striatellus]
MPSDRPSVGRAIGNTLLQIALLPFNFVIWLVTSPELITLLCILSEILIELVVSAVMAGVSIIVSAVILMEDDPEPTLIMTPPSHPKKSFLHGGDPTCITVSEKPKDMKEHEKARPEDSAEDRLSVDKEASWIAWLPKYGTPRGDTTPDPADIEVPLVEGSEPESSYIALLPFNFVIWLVTSPELITLLCILSEILIELVVSAVMAGVSIIVSAVILMEDDPEPTLIMTPPSHPKKSFLHGGDPTCITVSEKPKDMKEHGDQTGESADDRKSQTEDSAEDRLSDSGEPRTDEAESAKSGEFDDKSFKEVAGDGSSVTDTEKAADKAITDIENAASVKTDDNEKATDKVITDIENAATGSGSEPVQERLSSIGYISSKAEK